MIHHAYVSPFCSRGYGTWSHNAVNVDLILNIGMTFWETDYTDEEGNRDTTYLEEFQIGSGAHSASSAMGTGRPFFGGKATGAWSWSLTSI
jgi:hypothetical protein